MTHVMLTQEERSAILDRELQPYLRDGWRIQARSEGQAQLVLPARKKSGCLIIVLLLLGIVPGIIYLMWPSRDELLTITVDATGHVQKLRAQG
jgi:hypothetical protein